MFQYMVEFHELQRKASHYEEELKNINNLYEEANKELLMCKETISRLEKESEEFQLERTIREDELQLL